jgi:hypothetical protein
MWSLHEHGPFPLPLPFHIPTPIMLATIILALCSLFFTFTSNHATKDQRQRGAQDAAPPHVSGLHQVWAPQLFYTYFYNHAHRPRLEKLLYLELFRSSNGFFKPLLDPDDGFTSKTAERQI